jgi:hypothetical protein
MEPNIKFMSPGSPEYAEAQQAKEAADRARKANEVAHERRKWRDAKAIYEQTLQLVEAIWGDRLDAAQQTQQALAEDMRDRTARGDVGQVAGMSYEILPGRGAEIPVPLFTPRDRVQFLKEATTAFLIFGEKRGLQALPKDPPAEQQEAGSGTSEEAGEVALAEGRE